MARQIRTTRYHPSTLVLIRRKWYVSVTKPKELQFGKDKQSRRSTGTSDKRQAEKLQHELTQNIYDEFDNLLKRSDPVFELLRPEFEKAGLPVLDWYRKGEMSVVIKTGPLEETWTAESQRDLCALAIQLKQPIPHKVFSLLSEIDREWLQSAVKPSSVPVDLTLRVAALEKDLPGVPRRLLEMAEDATVVGSDEVVVEDPDAPTLHDLLPAFLKTRTETQQRVDRIQLNKWINHPTFGKKPLKAIDKFDAYEFLEEQGEDLTKSSIRVLRASLSNVYNWLNRKRE